MAKKTLEPQQARSRESTRKLLKAAAEVLGQHGLEGTTIPRIAQHAGLTPGAVYRRFPDKDALLEAVVRHWDALGSTSVEGLRASFLARAGKLSERADGDYLLQVEAQSFDILLDRLPWSVSIVELPWMERQLWVEWR